MAPLAALFGMGGAAAGGAAAGTAAAGAGAATAGSVAAGAGAATAGAATGAAAGTMGAGIGGAATGVGAGAATGTGMAATGAGALGSSALPTMAAPVTSVPAAIPAFSYAPAGAGITGPVTQAAPSFMTKAMDMYNTAKPYVEYAQKAERYLGPNSPLVNGDTRGQQEMAGDAMDLLGSSFGKLPEGMQNEILKLISMGK